MQLPNDFGNRLQDTFKVSGQLCIGIDPHPVLIKDWGLPDTPEGLYSFSNSVLQACIGNVGIIKAQVSFFERFGPRGFEILERITNEAREAGLLVIVDAKRGDIGTTMSAYLEAWFGQTSGFFADALTVSPYLGLGAITQEFGRWALASKGLFSLVATSNPEGALVQQAVVNGRSLAAEQFQQLSDLNGGSFGPFGAVVGATLSLNDFGISTGSSSVPILAPGFGVQGAQLSDAREIFGEKAEQVVYSVSRSVLALGSEGIHEGLRDAKAELELALE